MEAGNILKFPNISRHNGGEYNCSANNVCGDDSKTVFIDVQCESVKCIVQIMSGKLQALKHVKLITASVTLSFVYDYSNIVVCSYSKCCLRLTTRPCFC